MAITDAPDGTLWVQNVNVDVDVPEPITPPTYDILEEIKDDIEAMAIVLAAIEAWEFSTLQGDVASLEEYMVPVTEVAAGNVGRYSGSATTYQTVASWTVTTGKTGVLKEIILLSDDYDHTVFQITVGSITFSTAWTVQGAIPLIFDDLRLAAGSIVKVEAKSDDGTAIVVDAVITAKETT